MAATSQPTSHHDMQCDVCQRTYPRAELSTGAQHPQGLNDQIAAEVEGWGPEKHICPSCLRHFRGQYVQRAIEMERGELSKLEAEVVRSLQREKTLAENISTRHRDTRSFGERVADRMAEFGGSWTFIIVFTFLLGGWIVFNRQAPPADQFDPYPFIFLNLVLSCLAALQAPIIMMSQNRQASWDRLQAEQDFKVNLKAELEVRYLHTKLDQLMTHQWQRLLEIQEIQTQLMEELAGSREIHAKAPRTHQ